MNCLIVEDDLKSQERIKKYVEQCNELNLIAIMDSIHDAREILGKGNIGLLFLDVELSEGANGLELYRSLEKKPAVIVMTAHARYAVDSYSEHIEGFLQKPFGFEEFRKELVHVLNKNKHSKIINDLEKLAEETGSFVPVFEMDGQPYKVPFMEITYIEQLDHNILIHTSDKKQYMRKRLGLNEMEIFLPFQMFQRINKSVIVNKMYASVILDSVEVAGKLFKISAKYKYYKPSDK